MDSKEPVYRTRQLAGKGTAEEETDLRDLVVKEKDEVTATREVISDHKSQESSPRSA